MTTIPQTRADATFQVMGTRARVLAIGPSFLGPMAQHRLEQLEDRWTRFRPSELTRLNDRAGRWVPVSDDTLLLARRVCEGWRMTSGRFDPTVHDAMIASGYRRDFASLSAVGRPVAASPADPTPGCVGIAVDPLASAVRLPAGVHLDAGGLGKGLAADIVTSELMAAGAQGALVSLGGDVRVRGELAPARPWRIAIRDPATGGIVTRLELNDGAVATSSVVRRRWRQANGRVAHHVIDPRTGQPTSGTIRTASVATDDAWLAEVLATAAMVAGPAWESVLDGESGLVTLADGSRHGRGALSGGSRSARHVGGGGLGPSA